MGNHGAGRRAAGRKVAVACACLLLLPLAGCAEAATSAPTSSPPTPTPVFASDEEALAAATAAYANYQAMADQITGDGGKAPERIAKFVSEEYLPDEVQQYEGYRDANARSVGNTAFVVKSVQRLDYSDSSLTAISLYICDDVSGVEVFDENGASLVSESRKAVTPFEVEFVLNSEGILVIDSRDVWEQTNFC